MQRWVVAGTGSAGAGNAGAGSVGTGSSDKPRLRLWRRRPDISVMPVRELLHGGARIGLRGRV